MMNKQIWEQTKAGEWLDAKFYDEESGEIFLVEWKKEDGEEMEDFIARCQETADENFECARFVALITDAEGDYLGYDTY
jgi:hypothetical protein